jgi:hypothetical protein
MVYVGMKPKGVDEEQVKLKGFPFSLKGAAKAWFFSILPSSIGTWNGMKKIFLEKYFPASRVANKRKEIYGIQQSYREIHSIPSSSYTRSVAHSIFLKRTDAY